MTRPTTPSGLQTAVSFAGGAFLKTLASTLRFTCRDDAAFYDPARRTPLVLCIWHNRLLGAVLGDWRSGLPRPVPISVLTSASKDGGWLEAVARRFRMGAVRGSSSRRGAAALVGLIRQVRSGGDVAITPDGPRGPNYHIAPGILSLARSTGAPIVPVEVQMSNVWHIGKRWDALWVPKPFSRLTLHFHSPLAIAESETDPARLDFAMGVK